MIENLPNEEWRDVGVVKGIDFSGMYYVSNMGRVKGCKRKVSNRKNGESYRELDENLLFNHPINSGYNTIRFSKSNKKYAILVHRLVAQTFIPNDDPNKTQINHIDEDKTNNRVKNLEWVTPKENINYGTHTERVTKANMKNGCFKKLGELRSKTVVQLDILTDKVINTYPSTYEAARNLKIKTNKISDVCNGKRKSCGGFKWQYI